MPSDVPAAMLARSSFLLGKLHAALLDAESSELGQLGLDVKQHAVLAVLVDEGSMTQQNIGQRLGIDRTTVVAVVDGLDESGLVERRRSPADRRAYLLTPTRAGRQLQKRGQRLVETAEKQVLEALSEPEQRMLIDLLARAVSAADLSARAPGEL